MNIAVSRHIGLRRTGKLRDRTGHYVKPYVQLTLKARTGAASLTFFLWLTAALHTVSPAAVRPSYFSTGEQPVQPAAVRRTDAVRKVKGRVDADRIRRAKESTVKQGHIVLLRQQKQNKLSTPFEQDPYTVVDRKGCSVILEKDGKQIMRHVYFVKRWVQPEPDTVVPIGVAGERLVSHSTAPVETHEQDTRPQRTRRMPTHFVDYRLDTVP